MGQVLSVLFSCIPYVFTPYCSQHESLFYVETVLLFMACISIETAFTVVIIYASEVFPTSIRSTASGCLYLCSRMGAIAAPYTVSYLQYPQYLVSGILIVTLFLIAQLKETKGLKLETDVEEKLKKEDLIPKEEVEEEKNDIKIEN